MTALRDIFPDRHFLWDMTERKSADAIAREGFRLSRGEVRWMHRERAVCFYHSIPALLGGGGIAGLTDTSDMDVFLCAIDLQHYQRGVHYAHEAADVLIFHVPLPPEAIVARLPVEGIRTAEGLWSALQGALRVDPVPVLQSFCVAPDAMWSSRARAAGMLWQLSPAAFREANVARQLFAGCVPSLSGNECARLEDLLVKCGNGFVERVLDFYFGTYLNPHLARAFYGRWWGAGIAGVRSILSRCRCISATRGSSIVSVAIFGSWHPFFSGIYSL